MIQKDIRDAYERACAVERAAKARFNALHAADSVTSLRQLKALADARREWDNAKAEMKKLADQLDAE